MTTSNPACEPDDGKPLVPESGRLRYWVGFAEVRVERWSLWICFLTALVVTFSLYPGWFFFDSAQQWAWARLFVDRGWPHHLREYMVTSHWPIVEFHPKLSHLSG